jgi:Cu/Ag efflux protein CusF
MFNRFWLVTSTLVWCSSTWAQSGLPTTDAEVRKVDVPSRKITLKHGEIKNLDMPPMTMVFEVRDPALLSGVQAGDTVRFTADKISGRYTVLGLERVAPR